MMNLDHKKIAVLGVGKMGEALVSGLLHNKSLPASQLLGSTRNPDRSHEVGRRLGIRMFKDNRQMVEEADVIILAVKPQNMKSVLQEIAKKINRSKLVITIAAATGTRMIEEFLGSKIPVIRAMPNTPCLVNEGMTVLCPGEHVGKPELELAKEIFASVGRVEVLHHEELMDAVTALSGSGPAYAYVIIESLAEGGVKAGLPRDLATTLAAQSILGGAKMVLETGEHPAKLKDSVTTPAGVAMDGIMELEDGGVRVALIKAVAKATEKSKEISH